MCLVATYYRAAFKDKRKRVDDRVHENWLKSR